MTAVVVAPVLLAATALASFLPALRASRMDPVSALRMD
jgi:ABC-type lipoprotein release transport system permease subunit